MANTKKLMTGIISAAVILSGCSTQSEYDTVTPSNEEETKTSKAVQEVDNDKKEGQPITEGDSNNKEVELEYLKERYPNLDLDAMEDYMEENNMEITKENEDELIAFLDDIQKNGEPTDMENEYASSGSSFPWWLFLLMNRNGGSSYPLSSGIKNGAHHNVAPTTQSPGKPASSQLNPVQTTNHTGKEKTNDVTTQTQTTKADPTPNNGNQSSSVQTRTNSENKTKSSTHVKSSISSKTSSGFGSGSSSSGS